MKYLAWFLLIFLLVGIVPLAAVTALDITEAEARVARATQAHNDALNAYTDALKISSDNDASRQAYARERALQQDLDKAQEDLNQMRDEFDKQNQAALRAKSEKEKVQADADALKSASAAQLKANEEQNARRWADLRAWQKNLAANSARSADGLQQAINHLSDALNQAVAAAFADPARNAEAFDLPKELMPIAKSLFNEPPIHRLLFDDYGSANTAYNDCGNRLEQAASQGKQITAEHNALVARYNAGGGNDAGLRAQIDAKKAENARQLALCESIAQEYQQLNTARLSARKRLDDAMATSYLSHAKEWLAEWFNGGGGENFTPPDGLPAPDGYFPLIGYPAKGIPYWTFPNGQRTPNISKVIDALAPHEVTATDASATDPNTASEPQTAPPPKPRLTDTDEPAAELLGGSTAGNANDAVLDVANLGGSTPATKPVQPAPKLAVGDSAPPLAGLTWLNGEPITTFDADKVYLVCCWAEWAPPSLLAIKHLNELADDFRGQNLVVIDVNVDRTAPAPTARSVQSMRFRAAADNADKRFVSTWITPYDSIPYSFLISNGKIVWTGLPFDITPIQIANLLAHAVPPGSANQLYVAAVKSAAQARSSADSGDGYAALRGYLDAARCLATIADHYTDSPLALDLVQGKATLQDLPVTKLFGDTLPALGVSLASADPFILSDLTANRAHVLPELQDRAALAVTLAKAGRLDDAKRLCERLPVIELRDLTTRTYANPNNHLRAQTAIAILRALPAGDPRLADFTAWTIATVGLPASPSNDESVLLDGHDLLDALIATSQFAQAKALPLPPKQYVGAIFAFIDDGIATLAPSEAKIRLQAHAPDLDRASLANLWWNLGFAWNRTPGGHDQAEDCYRQALAASSEHVFKDIPAYLDIWTPGFAPEDTLALPAKSSPANILSLLLNEQDWPAYIAYVLSTETNEIYRTGKLIDLLEKIRLDPALAPTYQQVVGIISRFPPSDPDRTSPSDDPANRRLSPYDLIARLVALGEFKLADTLLRHDLATPYTRHLLLADASDEKIWPRLSEDNDYVPPSERISGEIWPLMTQIYAVACSTEWNQDKDAQTFYTGQINTFLQGIRLLARRGIVKKDELDSLSRMSDSYRLDGWLASKNETLLNELLAKAAADSEERQKISAALETIRLSKLTSDQCWAEASSASSAAAKAKARAATLAAAFASHAASAFSNSIELIRDAEAAFNATPAPGKEDSAVLEDAESSTLNLLAANHRAQDAWQAFHGAGLYGWIKEHLVIACADWTPDDAHTLYRLHAAELDTMTAPKARARLQDLLAEELCAFGNRDDHSFASVFPARLRESSSNYERRFQSCNTLLSSTDNLMKTAPTAALAYARAGVETIASGGDTAFFLYQNWCEIIVKLSPDADALPLIARIAEPNLRVPLLIELGENSLAAQHFDVSAAALAAAGIPTDPALLRRVQVLGIHLQLATGHPDDAVTATLALADPETRSFGLSQLGVYAATHPHPWSEASSAKLTALARELIGHPDVMHPDSLPLPFPSGV